jgi:hypothetical protein
MMNIDAISLESVVGGAGAPAKKTTTPAAPSSSANQGQQDAITLGADAASGCLSGISSKLGGTGGPNWSQIGLSCLGGALSGVGTGLGKLFGGSSSSTSTTKTK